MTFLDRLNLPKLDFTQNLSGGKIIKFQQSQALTSHFESFWSIVKKFPILIKMFIVGNTVDTYSNNSLIRDFYATTHFYGLGIQQRDMIFKSSFTYLCIVSRHLVFQVRFRNHLVILHSNKRSLLKFYINYQQNEYHYKQ